MDHIITDLGLTAIARVVGCKPPSVSEWRTRGIPPERCPDIERGFEGRYHCEAMRPDKVWYRVADPDWPWHPEGRPLLDVAARKPAETAPEIQEAAQ
jgi:hypothetical protein